MSLLKPVPSWPRALIGTVWIPKPLIFKPSFNAEIVVATWVPCESEAAAESVGSESYPSPSPALVKGTKSNPPSANADVVHAVDVFIGEPVSITATATSFTSCPMVVSTESRPIWDRPHW